MNVGVNEMVQQAKALAGRLDNLSWILKTQGGKHQRPKAVF